MALSAAQKKALSDLIGSTTPAKFIEDNESGDLASLAIAKPQAQGITITYTANDPAITGDGAVTVADGAAPTASELLELIEEIIDSLKAAGIMS